MKQGFLEGGTDGFWQISTPSMQETEVGHNE